jgi:hypothetical protein
MQPMPEDLVSLFAVAARDVLWFKPKVIRFFEKAGVPESILVEIRRRQKEPTIKLCYVIIDALEHKGEEGKLIIQRLVTTVAEWHDLSHLQADKQQTARERQFALKNAIREYANKARYQEEKERRAQNERENRTAVSKIDHARLQGFRERFDAIYVMSDRRARGDAFEALMNEIFDYYCQKSLGPFRRDGEQIDGQFYFDGHYYYVEVRWREDRATAADLSVLRDRASAGFGGDVRALFVSFNGYTKECLLTLVSRSSTERVVLMDGSDLRTVLNADIAFDVLLDEKLARAVRDGRAFVPAREIVLERIQTRVG